MEFRGADFIKKVQIKQEAEELRHRIEELEAKSMDYDDRKYEEDLDEDYETKSRVDNLSLHDLAINEQPEKPKIDKKKLAFLVFFLAIVFIFTVILIRFFMNYSNQNDLLSQNKIDENQIEQKFEQIVSQTKDVKKDNNATKDANVTVKEQTIAPQTTAPQTTAQVEKVQQPQVTKTANEQKPQNNVAVTPIITEKKIVNTEQPKKDSVVTQKIEKKPEQKQNQQIIKEIKIEPKPKQPEKKAEPKRDMKELFGFNQAQKIEQKTESKIEQKTQEKTKQVQSKNTKFIQVGSFSKEPDQKLFDKLKKAGYHYETKDIKNGNTTVTKVIVGPIGEDNINQELTKIKQNIAPSAFIAK